MPTFTFQSFTASSVVAISAVQGAQSAAGPVPEWGLSNMNTATLDIARIEPDDLVAPVGIWFEVTAPTGFNVSEPSDPDGGRAYDPTAHDITYIWDFDDPGAFTAPLNMPTAWNNRNIDYGKKVYHVFDTPGTYVVEVWGIDRDGTTGVRTVSIEVLDPDLEYPGNRTICVSNQGDFTGAPAGAQQLATLGAAEAAYRALPQTGRILLRRGETFTETFRLNDQQDNHDVGAFGPEADGKPILATTSGGTHFGAAGFSIVGLPLVIKYHGLRFQGEWDAAKETGDWRHVGVSYDGYNRATGWNSLFYQCEFDGIAALGPFQRETEFTSAVVDCDITNWQDYGIAVFSVYDTNNQRIALVGNSIHQKENAARNAQGKNGLGNDHGPVRIAAINEIIISVCDFFSANSWFPAGQQPCLRLFAAYLGNPGGQFLNANRIALEGGTDLISLDGQAGDVAERPGNFIFDKLLMVSDYATQRGLRLAYGGVTVRNAYAVYPAIAALDTGPVSAFSFPRDVASAENDGAKRQVYNCTVLNQLSGNAFGVVSDTSGLTDLTVQNTIEHQPGLGSPITPDAPIDLSQLLSGFTTRNRGWRVSVEKVSTSIGPVGNGQSFTIGYPSGTSASDFSPGGRHTVKIGNDFYFSYRGQCSFSFGSSITVTNMSGQTWSGSAQLGLDQDTLTTNTAYGSPPTLPLALPGTGPSALTDQGGLQAYSQWDTGLRTRPQGAF